MEWISKLLEATKLPARFAWATSFATGLLLVLPPSALTWLRVDSFVKDNGKYIGMVFLVSAVLAAVNLATMSWNWIKGRISRKARQRALIHALHSLDKGEKAVLREFLIQGLNTIRMPIDHPIVAGMLAKRILTQVGTMGERSLAGALMPVAKTPAVDGILTMSMIDLPEGEPTEQEIEFARNNRPEFMPEIEHHIGVFHTTWRARM